MKLLITKDKRGEFLFRLITGNNRIVSGGESYTRSNQCLKGFIRAAKRVIDGKVEFYRDRNKEWRWRIIARNGKNLLTPLEGYTTENGCKTSFKKLQSALAPGKTIVVYPKYEGAKYPEPQTITL